mgnify:CR=1 FL=1
MILILVPFLIVLLDRITKLLIVATMQEGQSIPVLPGVFHITYILNPGAAFGMFAYSRLFFLAIAMIALGVIWWYRKDILADSVYVRWGTGLFMGGTLGNVWDRIQNGLVIDFLDFRIWPVFNVADMAICTGVGLIIWNMLQAETRRKLQA